MKKRNGFTLVELLAVIVVLAIIMIIAIPAVLDIMNKARKQTFAEAINKYVTAVQTQYISDSNMGSIPGAGLYVYNIKSDLGLTSTGSYEGYVVVDARNVDKVEYVLFMRDNNYMITNYPIIASKMPDKDSAAIVAYNTETWSSYASSEVKACSVVAGQGSSAQCLNKDGYVVVTG